MKKMKQSLVNSKIQKVKQIFEKTFSFEVYKQKERRFLVVVLGKGLFLSGVNYESKVMTNFCQILRKHLTNQIIQIVQQHEFDRIVEIETRDYRLILELFGNGNIILVNKSDGKIVSASEIRSWKDRVIRPRREYKYPPSRVNPFTLSLAEFKKLFGKKEAVKVLASDLGFGGEVAEEICKRVGLDKESKSLEKIPGLYNFLKNVEEEFKDLQDINEELKKEFERDVIKQVEKGEVEKIEKKFERIREKQLQKLEELTKKEKTYRDFAKSIYNNYSELNEIL